MLSATEQLERTEQLLLATGGVPLADPLILVEPLDRQGSLRLGLAYSNGYRLHVLLALDTAYGYPLWTNYRFHLQNSDGQCIFRYNCAPHYPEHATLPHHKHVGPGETSVEHSLPTLRAIIDEIQRWVGR